MVFLMQSLRLVSNRETISGKAVAFAILSGLWWLLGKLINGQDVYETQTLIVRLEQTIAHTRARNNFDDMRK